MLFPYRDVVIAESDYNKDKDYRLEKTYELCVSELGLQQKKRDQTIAFYIAIISFVIPAIISMKQSSSAKGAGFLALYVLGMMLAHVVVRYRVYKEVYWITCRTITQLYNFEPKKITNDIVKNLFYKTMVKNSNTVLVLLEEAGNGRKVSHWRSYRKILRSAETTLYQVLILMSSMVLWIALYTFVDNHIYGSAAATVLALASYVYGSVHYYKQLTKVYDVLIDGENDSFEAAFSKAWFLQFF